MNNYRSEGSRIVVPAPAGGVISGQFIVVGGVFGVCQTTQAEGEDVVIVREGVFELPKAVSGVAWLAGKPLYWDPVAAKFTTVATGNMPLGVAAEPATDADTLGLVSIEAVSEGFNAVAGVAAGYALARGVAAATGTLDVDTGLATVVAASVSLAEDPALTGDRVSYVLGAAGHITVKVWKPTAANDVTPIAATAAKNVGWTAVGTPK